MEQYELPKELDFQHLRFCLDNYPLERIYIRDCGGYNDDGTYRVYGKSKVNETFENKKLDFKQIKDDFWLFIDNKEIFHFALNEGYYKGFTLAYERRFADGRYHVASTGIDPYDPALPEPHESFLRTVLNDENSSSHLMEIYFKGRIPLKFHSWWEKPHWKYWTISK